MLLENGKRIILIVGQNETSNLKDTAVEYQIPFVSPKHVNGLEFETELKGYGANLFILCGYNKILKSNILSIPKHQVINCHGGKIPEYRGTAPINWQLINGEEILGFTILYANKGIDTGGILDEYRFEVDINTNANEVLQKSLEWFPKQLTTLVSDLETNGFLEKLDQDESAAVHYTRRYPEDGQVNWKEMTDYAVHNLVRALVRPYPGAYTFLEEKKVIIIASEILEEEYRGVPGRVALKRENGVIVTCKNRAILIKQVENEGLEEPATNFFKIGQYLNVI
jgi:methionyl-tRNA formyltransferase